MPLRRTQFQRSQSPLSSSTLYRSDGARPSTQNNSPSPVAATTNSLRVAAEIFRFVKMSCNLAGAPKPNG